MAGYRETSSTKFKGSKMTKQPKSNRRKLAIVFTALAASAIFLNPTNVFSQSGGNGAPATLKPTPEKAELEFQRQSSLKYLKEIEKKLKEFRSQRKEEEKRFADLSEKYEASLKKDDGNIVSTESYTAIIQTLQSQRVELLVDVAGMEAREKAISEIRNKMEAEGTGIISQLEQLVEIQKSNLQAVSQRYKVAAASKAEVNAAQSKLLEVEIRLAEAKQKSKSPAYLDDFFVKSSLDQAEKKARLEMTESLLASFAQSRARIEEQISIQNHYKNSKMQLEMIKNNIKLYERRVDGLKKDVSELDAKLKPSGDKEEN